MIVERSVRANGWQMSFRENGSPDSPALFLLHAMGPDGSDWDAVSEAMADRYHVIAVHQRGFGPGERPGAYTFELMRDDVLALATALGIEQFTIIGHSMGGTVAYLIAQKAPERVVQLVVEDTPPPWGGDMADPPAEPPQPVPYDWQAWRGIARQLKYPDPRWWDELPDIACPALIIGGGATSHVPQDMLLRVANLIPDAHLVTFEGAGHLVHTARPAEFLTAVRTFLSS